MQTNPLSQAESALLGLLNEGPKHAYEIEKVVRERCMRDWTELSMASIYRLLAKLEREKRIASRSEVHASRTRKVYRLTAAGRAALKESVRTLASKPQLVKWDIDVALLNLNVIGKPAAKKCLRAYREDLKKQIAYCRELEMWLEQSGFPPHAQAIATRKIHLFEGELNWINRYLK